MTRIEIWDLEANAEPARLRVMFSFAGRRRFTDPGQADAATDGETMRRNAGPGADRPGSQPWRVSSGHVETLDDFLGYVFTSRRETAQEYRQRTGLSPAPATVGSGPRSRLTAGFAEHDERFGSSVQLEVRQQAALDRDEAVRLGWPAIERQIAQALGEGDWRPSLSWLDVVELLDKPPRGLTSRLRPLAPADPARDTGGMVDDTARDLAIYQALKAADEVAAALQTHLIEEHGADPERAAPQAPAAISLRLLRQARERLGRGLRAIEADHIAASDEISLRRGG